MLRGIFLIVVVMILISDASAQEVLYDQQDYSIGLPDVITSLYINDLNGDSLRELIATTNNGIYVFGGNDMGLVWSSPPLIRPSQLIFPRLSVIDTNRGLAVKDSSYIYLFDVWDDSLIWSSSELDRTYIGYTAGDRNDDGQADIIIVRKEPFSRPGNWDNLDTAWVDIYDGPNYLLQDSPFFLLSNADVSGPSSHSTKSDIPTQIDIQNITGEEGLSSRILLFSNTTYNAQHWDPGFGEWHYSGNIRIIDCHDFNTHTFIDTGINRGYLISGNTGQQFLYLISYTWGGTNHGVGGWAYINKLNADTVLSSSSIWWGLPELWKGYVIDEINSVNAGLELSFMARDSLYLYSIEQPARLWAISKSTGDSTIQFLYNNPTLFNTPQTINRSSRPYNLYRFYNGLDGSLTASMPIGSTPISQVSDLDNNGEDELIAVHGDSITVFSILFVTGTNDYQKDSFQDISCTAYPNPFNATTTISFTLKADTQVKLEVFNLIGQEVATLLDGLAPAGMNTASFNGDNLSSGLYFARLSMENTAKSIKLVLLK